MSKGTIIYIGGFELPDKNAAAHRVLGNAKVIKEIGYNVILIDIDKSLKSNTNISLTHKTIQGFECWSLPYPNSNISWLKYLIHIDHIKYIINNSKDVKAIIAYNYPAIALSRIKTYCVKHNIKVISDCTEWYSTKGRSIIYKIVKAFDTFLRMRIIQKRLDGLIVISKYLESYYIRHKNIIRVPPLVDMKEDKWCIRAENCNENLIKLVYSGSPGRNKDKLNIVLEALNMLDENYNYIFNIIGITREEYLDMYPQHIKILDKLGESRIKFWGRLVHTESLKILSNSDFCIFVRENSRLTNAGFPTKFVESISSGIPVITTKTSDLEDYLYDGINGFFISTDIINLVKELNFILGMDRKIINKMKKNCLGHNMFYYIHYIDKFNVFLTNIIQD